MHEFLWIPHNRQKIANHRLREGDVEAAWRNSGVVGRGIHPEHGEYFESLGTTPHGREIWIVWRYDVDRDGEEKIFVITAY